MTVTDGMIWEKSVRKIYYVLLGYYNYEIAMDSVAQLPYNWKELKTC